MLEKHSDVLARQEEYERLFAIEYGKSVNSLTDEERRSPAVFNAHERTVKRMELDRRQRWLKCKS